MLIKTKKGKNWIVFLWLFIDPHGMQSAEDSKVNLAPQQPYRLRIRVLNKDDIELASGDWLLISFISIDAQSGRFVEISGCLKQWKACLLQQTIDFGAGGKRSLHSMFNVWTTKRKQPLVSKTNSVWKFTILRYMKRLHRCFIQILTLFK